VNKISRNERTFRAVSLLLTAALYAGVFVGTMRLAKQLAEAPQPAMGPKAINLQLVQVELSAAVEPPEKKTESRPIEEAEVALEEVIENPPEEELEPVQAEARVVQEVSAPSPQIETPDPLAGTSAEVDWQSLVTARVRDMIEHEKYYPLAATRAGFEGICKTVIRVNADGVITGVEVLERKGHPMLERAANKILSRLVGRNVEVEQSESLDVRLPIEFKLEK